MSESKQRTPEELLGALKDSMQPLVEAINEVADKYAEAARCVSVIVNESTKPDISRRRFEAVACKGRNKERKYPR